MNSFDKVKLTVEIFQDLKLLNTAFHREDLKKKDCMKNGYLFMNNVEQ